MRKVVDVAFLEAEIRGWDELIAEHGDASDAYWRERVAVALMRKSAVLAWELGRPEEAIEVWDEVSRRYSAAPEPALRDRATAALYKKALTLIQLGRRPDAFRVYREIAMRRGRSRGSLTQRMFALVMVAAVSVGLALRVSGQLGALERWIWRGQDRARDEAGDSTQGSET
jgi:hypothetical protein